MTFSATGRRKAGETKVKRTRARIQLALLDIVEERGLFGWTMEDVAAAAGVSLATLYRRYPSKEELLKHVQILLQQLDDPPCS